AIETDSASDCFLINSRAMASCRSKDRSSDRSAARAFPLTAFSTLATNALVNPPIAETKITGRSFATDFTIVATLRKAFASSKDVPPNFKMVGFINIRQTSVCRFIGTHFLSSDKLKFVGHKKDQSHSIRLASQTRETFRDR